VEKFTQKIGSFFCHTVYFCFVTFCYCHHVSRFLFKKNQLGDRKDIRCRCKNVHPKVLCQTHADSTTPPQPFYGPFPGPPGWAGARRELLDFMVQRKINRGRHTDHPSGRHSILTNQCPPPPSPHFLQSGCPSCRPTNSVIAQKAISAFGLGRRR